MTSPVPRRVRTAATGRYAVVACIDGPAGMGKSAVAIAVLHASCELFDGGIIPDDLAGYAGPATAPPTLDELLTRWLGALGVDGSLVPAEPTDLLRLWRTVAARLDAPLAVLVDNVTSRDQVRDLTPARDLLNQGNRRRRLAPGSRLRQTSGHRSLTGPAQIENRRTT